VRRKVVPYLVALVALATAAPLVVVARAATTPTPATAAAKIAPALRQLVADGYGDVDIASMVPGYVAGHVEYLAKVTSIDPVTRTAVAATGARIRHEFPEIGWVALDSTPAAVGAVASLAQVTQLRVDDVKHVLDLDVRYVDAATAAAGGYLDQTKRGTHDVGADALWARGITGTGVVVGVADSGIDQTHPDLDGDKITQFVDCSAVLPNLAASDDANGGVGDCLAHPGYDDNGHGTHVSGIAVGSADGGTPDQKGKLPGMAPGASLAGAKVCTPAGTCLNSSVMAGFRWLATDVKDGGAGADVVNMSLGGGRVYGSPVFGAEQVTDTDPEAQLVNQLADKYNVVFTISAGNSGPVFQSVGNPSVAAQAISIGASIADFDLNHPVDQTEHGEFGDIRPEAAKAGATAIASFSSRGPSGDRQIKPELTAPGSYVVAAQSKEGGEVGAADAAHMNHYSQDLNYAVLSGTSMSSPAAAGVAALLVDGFRQATGGRSPQYFHVKAAMANTAGTHAFEGPVAGLLGTIKSRTGLPGQTPAELYPNRNDGYVGVSGEGAGRVNAVDALLALTKGVIAYTPRSADGKLDDKREQQPNWAMDDVAPGQSRRQVFMFHPAPGRTAPSRATFHVDSGTEPAGIHAIPASWFALPKSVTVAPGGDTGFFLNVRVPAGAAPGQWNATVVADVALGGGVTQHVRIPVQLFVPLPSAPAASVEGPIWASQSTDWSVVGAENPEGDVYTDWSSFPLRLDRGTSKVDLSVYDANPDGADHMDVFVFDDKGVEIDSTVTNSIDHSVPEALALAPTTKDSPATVSLLDGNDLTDVVLPTTVWIMVADSGRTSASPGFRNFHLDVKTAGGGTGGTTPPDRIHSGDHAWWSGSGNGMTSTLTRSVPVPAGATSLSFWTWYQLEDGYDWAYALVSTDNGATWTSLASSSPEDGSGTTDQDPLGLTGNVLGGSKAHPNGFTGDSGSPATFTGQNLFGGVLSHQVADVSAYAGKTVLLRFAATSDAGTSLDGFYVDDLALTGGGGAVLWSDPVDAPTGWTPGGQPGFAFVTKAAG
jgi:subtilisin family serine protease